MLGVVMDKHIRLRNHSYHCTLLVHNGQAASALSPASHRDHTVYRISYKCCRRRNNVY
jgi:hypothetical protein